MYRCLFCGYNNPSEKARFCVQCGPDGVAKDWTQEDIDQSANVSRYVSMISELYFDERTSAAVEKFSLRMRERLKISHDTHVGAIAKLAAQKKAIAHLANFRIEFNENVTDAYAGHDTYLSFRYTNLSEDDLFKISLLWDDPETTDRIDLRAQTSSFVKPQGSSTLGGSVIFDRMGIKELVDMQITIADQFGDSANFKAEPFSFRVGNHDQRITQNISTHNQISIEGRGVVDASGMGAEKTSVQSTENNQEGWRELSFSYVPTAKKAEENEPVTQAKVAAPESIQQKVDIVDPVKTTHVKYVPTAKKAEENEPVTQAKVAAPESIQQKVDIVDPVKTTHIKYNKNKFLSTQRDAEWYFKAAKQGDARACQYIGDMYSLGNGVAQSHEKAVYWYRKAAKQGHPPAQCWLGDMYQKGQGVVKDNEKAFYWYRKAAEQRHPPAQCWLGDMYQKGQGVVKDKEKAFYWYRKAAEQGERSAIETLKNLES